MWSRILQNVCEVWHTRKAWVLLFTQGYFEVVIREYAGPSLTTGSMSHPVHLDTNHRFNSRETHTHTHRPPCKPITNHWSALMPKKGGTSEQDPTQLSGSCLSSWNDTLALPLFSGRLSQVECSLLCNRQQGQAAQYARHRCQYVWKQCIDPKWISREG